jgi:hypothetical protein
LGVCQKYYLANQLKGYEKVWKDPPGFNDACRDPVAEEDWGTELWDDWPFSINVSSNANEDINWETSISSKSTSMLWLLGLENIWAVERDDVDRRNWTNADPFPPATTAAAGSRWQGWWDMQHKIYVHCPFHFVFAINQKSCTVRGEKWAGWQNILRFRMKMHLCDAQNMHHSPK